MEEKAKVKEHKTIVDSFVEGARNGYKISINSMVPNVLFAFVLIQILNLTGLSDILGKVCQPVMGLFGLPGIAATVLIAGFLSVGGGVGAAADHRARGGAGAARLAGYVPAVGARRLKCPKKAPPVNNILKNGSIR